MRKFVLTKVCFLMPALFFANAYAEDDELMSLQQAVNYAIESSPQLQTMRESMSIAQLELANAKADFLPTLQLNSTLGYTHDNQTIGPNESKGTLNLTLANTFYDNGRKQIYYTQQQRQQQLSILEYQRARDQLIQAVYDAYLRLSQARELVTIEQSSLALIERQAKLAAQLYERGLGRIQEKNRFANEVRRAKLALISAEESIKTARIELLQKLGLNSTHSDYSQLDFASLEVTPAKIAALQPQALDLAQTYEYRIVDIQRQIDDAQLRLVQKDNQAELKLVAHANYGNAVNLGREAPTMQKSRFSAFAGVEFKLMVFDGGKQQRNLQIAHANRNKQQYKNLHEMNLVNEKINALMLNLNARLESYTVSQLLFQAEQENYNQIVRDYQNGNATYLDLITALSDFTKSKKQYNDIIYSLLKGRHTHYYYQGVLYDKIFAQA